MRRHDVDVTFLWCAATFIFVDSIPATELYPILCHFFTGIHQDASGNWVLSSDATSTGWDLAQIGVDISNMAYNLSG